MTKFYDEYMSSILIIFNKDFEIKGARKEMCNS